MGTSRAPHSTPLFVTFAVRILQATARFYAACLVSAIVLLHEEGILHRNVTPNCVYVTDLGYVQLADFTCAKKMDGNKVRYTKRSLNSDPGHGAFVGYARCIVPRAAYAARYTRSQTIREQNGNEADREIHDFGCKLTTCTSRQHCACVTPPSALYCCRYSSCVHGSLRSVHPIPFSAAAGCDRCTLTVDGNVRIVNIKYKYVHCNNIYDVLCFFPETHPRNLDIRQRACRAHQHYNLA